MRVALLTFHDTTNFGSFLQTYGLYSTLNKLGIDCEVLDYQCAAIQRNFHREGRRAGQSRKLPSFFCLNQQKPRNIKI